MNLPKKALEILHPRSLKHLNEHLQTLVQGKLWLKVLIAMVTGLTVGFLLGPNVGITSPRIAATITSWLTLPGQVFLTLVQMIVVPLIFASIIRGIAASENIEFLKKAGVFTAFFFLTTTTISILIGITITELFEPGKLISADLISNVASQSVTSGKKVGIDLASVPNAIIDLLPNNPLGSMVNLEMLQVSLFAMISGVALVSMPAKQALPVLDLLGSIQQVCMTVVRWAMKLAPLAVFGFMASLASKLGLSSLIGMAAYVGTVITGLILLNSLYLLAYSVLRRRSPLEFLRATREVQLLAFSTSSSAAVMPLSIKTSEEKLGVRPSIAQFAIPLGATVNMDGTALYQGVATVFLAQVFNIDLSVGALTLVVVTAVAASIGSPATPGVGIVILSLVLDSVGIPAAGIGLIMGVDRILDMSRTAVNVAGDLTASVFLDRYVGGKESAQEQIASEALRERTRAHEYTDTSIDEN